VAQTLRDWIPDSAGMTDRRERAGTQTKKSNLQAD